MRNARKNRTTIAPQPAARFWRPRCALLISLASATVMCSLVAAVVTATMLQDRPRELSRNLPLPSFFEALIGQDELAYRAHVSLGLVLEWLGGPPVAAASGW